MQYFKTIPLSSLLYLRSRYNSNIFVRIFDCTYKYRFFFFFLDMHLKWKALLKVVSAEISFYAVHCYNKLHQSLNSVKGRTPEQNVTFFLQTLLL